MTALQRLPEHDAITQALPAQLFRQHVLNAIQVDLIEMINLTQRVLLQVASAAEHGYSLERVVSVPQLLEAGARIRNAALAIEVERVCGEREGL